MKLKKNKFLKHGLFLTILIGLMVSPFSFGKKSVNAQTYTDTITEHGQDTEDYVFYRHLTTPSLAKSHLITVIKRDSDGHFVYCIQPGSQIISGVQYTGYTSDYAVITSMTPEQWKRVQLLAYYGYMYKDNEIDHTSLKWYSITQFMIWNSVPREYEIYFSSDLGNHRIEKYTNEIAEMERLLAKHSTGVSFNGKTVNLAKGETKTLTDSNGVLKEYTVESTDNVDAKISGNTLTLTAKNDGAYKVELSRKDKKYNTPPIAYISSESQNVVMVGSFDPILNTVKGTTKSGSINLKKYDSITKSCKSPEGASLNGTTFKLYKEDNTFIQDLVVDSSCNANALNLGIGRYYLKESKAGKYYEVDSEKHYFNITADSLNASITLYNTPMLGQVSIKKFDSKTNSCNSQGSATLVGAVYGIYKLDGTLVSKLTIGNNCTSTSEKNLPIAKYYIKEITAPNGYKLDETTHPFEINEQNYKATVNLTLTDEVYTSTLVINKTYLTDNGVKAEVGAKFDIISKTTNKVVATITIGESATGEVELPFDGYIIRQTKGMSGYKKSDDIDFTVNEKSKDKEYITLMNEPYTARVKVKKVDSTGKSIPMSGIKFKIFDITNNKYVCQTIAYPNQMTICEFETNENGEFITPKELYPGKYRLEEVDQLIDGYLWNSEGIEFTIDENSKIIKDKDLGEILSLTFENQEVKGKLEIQKIGEKVVIKDGNFTYVEAPLPNVTFGVYDESKNLIGKYKTDENGYLKVEDLKLGKYYLKELETLDGYILDENIYEFELKYQDQYTPIVTKSYTLSNYLKKSNLEFTKSDLSTSEGIKDTKIEIYHLKDDGKSELIFTGLTDENGKITITDLFVGKFYILESEAATGYLLSDEKVYFEIKENGEIVKAEMKNQKITGSLEFSKEDFSTDKPIPNTEIEIYDANTDELIYTGKTSEEGKIVISEIPYGDYYILEKNAPIPYALNAEKMYFSIKEDGEVIKATMKDKVITSKVGLHKVDEKNKPIEGVIIGVYKTDGTLLNAYVTDKNGDIEVELEYGSYYFQEIATIDGYVLSDEKVYFDVLNDGEVIQKTLVNELEEIEVPNTLSNSYLDLVAIGMIGLGGVLYITSKHKKNKKVEINKESEEK